MFGGNTFRFKRFAVEQSGCAMKVGTDGVLLGAWCRVMSPQDKAILDIGTGTGVIALQLAQRTEGANTVIEAVEIDPAACDAARRNFHASGWRDRLTLHCAAIQVFTENTSPEVRYDHIVSNPPFFARSLSSPDAARTLARHTDSLSYDDLMRCCLKLLKPDGRISLIIPAGAETERMIASAAGCGLVVSRRTEVCSTPKSGSKRTLLEFLHRRNMQELSVEAAQKSARHDRLVIEDTGPGTFSAEYRALTRDFYLYF